MRSASLPRILYLTPLAPLPATDGGRQRTNLLYQALVRCGEVDTAVINRTLHPISDEERQALKAGFGLIGCIDGQRISQQMPWKFFGPVGDQAAHLLRGWQSDFFPAPAARAWAQDQIREQGYDLIVSRYLWPAAHVGVIDAGLPLIIDVDDRESERVSSFMSQSMDETPWPWAKRRWWGRHVRQVAAAERRLLAKTSHIWLTKHQDRDAFGDVSWSLLPNIPFGQPGDVGDGEPAFPSDPPSILFVGSLGFAPNRRGVTRFLEASWPAIRQACPEARFVIAGGHPPESWGTLPGVETLGYVEDLRPYYEAASISVVPVWEGAGTKIKVLESLLHRRTLVVARHSMRGYEEHLIDGQSLRIAEDDHGMASGCIELLQNADLRTRLAQTGYDRVTEHYSQSVFEEHVMDTVRRVLDPLN